MHYFAVCNYDVTLIRFETRWINEILVKVDWDQPYYSSYLFILTIHNYFICLDRSKNYKTTFDFVSQAKQELLTSGCDCPPVSNLSNSHLILPFQKFDLLSLQWIVRVVTPKWGDHEEDRRVDPSFLTLQNQVEMSPLWKTQYLTILRFVWFLFWSAASHFMILGSRHSWEKQEDRCL